jgi:hypothetical protein
MRFSLFFNASLLLLSALSAVVVVAVVENKRTGYS